jgi:hypothetical protein
MDDVYRALAIEVFALVIVAIATALAIAAVRRRRSSLKSVMVTGADHSQKVDRENQIAHRGDVPSRARRVA